MGGRSALVGLDQANQAVEGHADAGSVSLGLASGFSDYPSGRLQTSRVIRRNEPLRAVDAGLEVLSLPIISGSARCTAIRAAARRRGRDCHASEDRTPPRPTHPASSDPAPAPPAHLPARRTPWPAGQHPQRLLESAQRDPQDHDIRFDTNRGLTAESDRGPRWRTLSIGQSTDKISIVADAATPAEPVAVRRTQRSLAVESFDLPAKVVAAGLRDHEHARGVGPDRELGWAIDQPRRADLPLGGGVDDHQPIWHCGDDVQAPALWGDGERSGSGPDRDRADRPVACRVEHCDRRIGQTKHLGALATGPQRGRRHVGLGGGDDRRGAAERCRHCGQPGRRAPAGSAAPGHQSVPRSRA